MIVTRVDSLFWSDQLTLGGQVGFLQRLGVDTEGESAGVCQDRCNFLILGLDRRPREGKAPTRSDTIIILSIDAKRKDARMLGIPRDLWVEIPTRDGGYYNDRINTAYVVGEMTDYPGGGIGLAKATIEHNFGITIDHYVIIDFEGFQELIDAIGGIDVNVPEAVYDPYYSWTELPGDYDPQYFEPGLQHMDGRRALAYARLRYNKDDLDRIHRQQLVIIAALEKAWGLDILKNPMEYWERYKDTIETDVSDFQVLAFAKLAQDIGIDNIVGLSLGAWTRGYTTPQGAAVLLADPDAIRDAIRALYGEDTAPPAEPGATAEPLDPGLVEVQNGAGVEGLAAAVARYIVAKGVDPADVVTSNATDGLSHSRTEIIVLDGRLEAAARIAQWLGLDESRVRAASFGDEVTPANPDANIVVILGTDLDTTRFVEAG
ncbi:MAG TPA: LCP family protein [Dehalococcoidia bacterium]|nr:LCP family protein [Dehalococcoidia bacterium]